MAVGPDSTGVARREWGEPVVRARPIRDTAVGFRRSLLGGDAEVRSALGAGVPGERVAVRGRAVSLELFDGQVVDLVPVEVTVDMPHPVTEASVPGVSWIGPGELDGAVVTAGFYASDRAVFGGITWAGHHLQVRQAGDGGHVLLEVRQVDDVHGHGPGTHDEDPVVPGEDPGGFDDAPPAGLDGVEAGGAVQRGRAGTATTALAGGRPPMATLAGLDGASDPPVIDILVLYANGSPSNILEVIGYQATMMNAALANSGMGTRVNITAREYINYNQLATLGGDRDKLKQGLGGSGSLKSAKSLRDFFRADVVSLVVPNNDANGALGIAYVPQRKPAPLDQWALNVWTVQGTVQHYSLAHEVGHNLGAGHSPDDGNSEEHLGAYSYSRGHRVAGGGSTVMVATPGYCGLPPNDCPLQLQYSNPGIGFLNRPWVPSGSSSANNALTIDQLNPVSANYRRAGPYNGLWSVSDDLDNQVEISLTWGGASSDIGIVGDWNGDGIDTPAVFRQATGQWFVSNYWNGYQDVGNFTWGGGPGDIPLAGDWDGDGVDTIGIYRLVDGLGQWHRNDHLDGTTEAISYFGGTGDRPFVHDYDGNGTDRPGVFRPWLTQTNWHLANTWGSSANVYCSFGGGVTDLPVVGRWPGASADRIGIYREGTWHLRNGCSTGTVTYVTGFGTALDRNPFVGRFTSGSIDTPGRFL